MSETATETATEADELADRELGFVPDDEVAEAAVPPAKALVRNWVFGARRPWENLEGVEQQMLLGHRYKNKLIEIERNRRTRIDEFLHARDPHLRALAAAYEAAAAAQEDCYQRIKRDNQLARRRRSTPAQSAEMRTLRAAARAAALEFRTHKATLWADPDVAAFLVRIKEETNAETAAARAASGVFWGTYMCVEQAAKHFRKGAPPEFRRWCGKGSIGLWFQGGMPVAEAFAGGRNLFRIRRPAAGAFERGGQRLRKTVCWMRIAKFGAAGEGGDKTWAMIPITMDRDFPADAKITWVKLFRDPIQPLYGRWNWRLVITLSGSKQFEFLAPPGLSPTVGIDLGWRLFDDGLRVAAWHGSDGREGELRIPKSQLDYILAADELRSSRGTAFDGMRAELAAWLAANAALLPEWLRTDAEHLGLWKGATRLAALVRKWERQRFDGDAAIFPQLLAWQRDDRRVHAEELGRRQRFVRWRTDLYRNWVLNRDRGMRMRYLTAAIEDINWAQLIRTPLVEQNLSLDWCRKYARFAAVGALANVLVSGMATVKQPPEYTTQRCHACLEIEPFDKATELVHTCSQCGTIWDQDFNAARLLHGLAEGTVPPV